MTKTPERGFELPFAQLLASAGHRIVHIDSHSPFEQGKDIISVDPNGVLCGYQLKQGNISQSDFRDNVMGELKQLVSLPCMHPSVDAKKCKPHLVVTGTLTEPAEHSLQSLNKAFENDGEQPVELLDHHWLMNEFANPSLLTLLDEPAIFRAFLELYQADGNDILNEPAIHSFIDLLDDPGRRPASKKKAQSRLAADLLAIHIATASAREVENHHASARALSTALLLIGRLVARGSLTIEHCAPSVSLLLDEVEAALDRLLSEAINSVHLLGPEPRMETRELWRTRVTLLCESASALCLIHRFRNGTPHEREPDAIDFICRHAREMIIWSEASAPAHILCFLLLRARPRTTKSAELILLRYTAALASRLRRARNQVVRTDPYFTLQECLELPTTESWREPRDRISTESYSLLSCIYLIRKALLRRHLSFMWADLSKISHMRMINIEHEHLFMNRSMSGTLVNRFLDKPTSWARLGTEIEAIMDDSNSELPSFLRSNPSLLVVMLFTLPQRLNAEIALRLDHAAITRGSDSAGLA